MLTIRETKFLVATALAGGEHLMWEEVEQIEDGIRTEILRQPHLVMALALLSVMRRKHERAIQLYRLMLELLPGEWQVRALLGRVLFDVGDGDWRLELGRALQHRQDPRCVPTVRSLMEDLPEAALMVLVGAPESAGDGASSPARAAAPRARWAA
jgi:hypothetical protein